MSARTLVINPGVGAAGDMLLSLLVELGASEETVVDTVTAACRPYTVRLVTTQVLRAHLRARYCQVAYDEGVHLGAAELGARIESSELGPQGKRVALRALDFLVGAEREVHGEQGDIHLHELGSLDTLIDLVGVSRGLEELQVERVVVSPVGLALTVADIAHGTVPLPGPAVASIVRSGRLECTAATGRYETATPTGVALLAAVCEELGKGVATGQLLRVGYGAGSRDIEGVANVVQGFVLIETEQLGRDSVAIIEVYLDDMTGEALGGVVDDLLVSGAIDAWYCPAFGKKGRPGFELTVLCAPDNRWAVADEVRRRVRSPGVRVSVGERAVSEVHFIDVNLLGQRVRVKVSEFGAKPEWCDVAEAAARLDLSRAEVSQRVMARYWETRVPGDSMER